MLTVEDFLTKDTDEILRIACTQKVPEEVELFGKQELDEIKKDLHGFFQADPSLIYRGQTLHLGEYWIDIASVLKSSDRIFFKLRESGKTFSIPRQVLLGVDVPEFAFKRLDRVMFQEDVWLVTGINPASNNLILEHVLNGDKRKVNAGKVTSMKEDFNETK